MTFYNIIFGILFIGACQEVLQSFGKGGDSWLLVLIAVMIFTDAVNTSEAVENRGVEYSIWMKLFDLASFLVLSATLILLAGREDNFLSAKVYDSLWPSVRHGVVPPILLLLYCLLVYLWTKASPILRQREEWPPKLRWGAGTLVAMLLLITVLRWFQMETSVWYAIAVFIAIVAAFVYLISYTLIPKPQSQPVCHYPQ